MRVLALLPVLFIFTGCDGPKAAVIKGTVTLNGQPVDDGVISFTPADGRSQTVTADIKNGQYEVKTFAGAFVVQITAPIVTGKRPEHRGPGAPMVDIVTERLPPKYNSATELTFEAVPGDNVKDWPIDLK